MKKKVCSLLLTTVLALSSTISAFACTGTIIGKNMSEDGTTLVARTEDIGGGHTKRYLVQPAMQYAQGAVFKDKNTGFTYPQPANAYKYTYVPDADVEGLKLKFMDIRKRTYKFPKLGSKCKMVSIPTTSGKIGRASCRERV